MPKRAATAVKPKASKRSASPARKGVRTEPHQELMQRFIQASLDAAQTTSENVKHWQHADGLSARASFTPEIRRVVRERSRLEADNNSWYSGILRTAANHIVGTGPRLQVLIPDNADGCARLERAWKRWAARVLLTEKLRVAIMTYWRDGEVYFLRRSRREVAANQVALEIVQYETDQVANPYWYRSDPRVDDGIQLDEFGGEAAFHILDNHPGDLNIGYRTNLSGQWYPAADVIHLYRRERPGQTHGIPRVTPSLELFPKLRRHTAATLLAAEAVANWTLFIKTNSAAVSPQTMPDDLMTLDFMRNMMTFLPKGWDPFQLKAEQPTTNHEMFQRQTLMEICRCFCMPLLLACGTSKDSNYSSAQMDLRNIWNPEVASEQDRLATIAVERLWQWFLEDAVFVPGLLDGLPPVDEIDHQWFWDPPPTIDELDAALAASERLRTGQSTLDEEWAAQGKDLAAAFERGAKSLGVTTADYQAAVFATLLNPIVPAPGAPTNTPQNVLAAAMRRREVAP